MLGMSDESHASDGDFGLTVLLPTVLNVELRTHNLVVLTDQCLKIFKCRGLDSRTT